MNFKLCNNGLSVVGKNENGMYVSYSIEADEYKQWLEKGNTPEPEFTEEEIVAQKHKQFRAERDLLLSKVDIAINKVEDLGQDTKDLRVYRQALRDATITWVMPEGIL